jgi:nicotinate phosphoribosyltransferase
MRKDQPIIQSLMDTDFYKFSMQKAFLNNYPDATAKYRFKCRTPGVNIGRYADEIRKEALNLTSLAFTKKELDYLQKIPALSGAYVDFLRGFRLNENLVNIEAHGRDLVIEAQGPLVEVMPFEIYLLSIVQEVFTRNAYPDEDYREARRRLEGKIAFLRDNPAATGFRYADFGGRRRGARDWHDHTVQRQSETLRDHFIGTSNVQLAMKYALPPVGTMAHEYLQAFQALCPRLADSQKVALEIWLKEFRGTLATALTDVVGMDAFLGDLDLELASRFDGFRHDSGCPYAWTAKLVTRLKALRIDPGTKTAVYSDNLSMESAVALFTAVKEVIRPLFGIGTNLTNDFGRQPLNLVMKMVACNDQPVAKISDSPGKGMCDDANFLRQLMQAFQMAGQAADGDSYMEPFRT